MPEKFDKPITLLVDNDGMLDKEATSYNDPMVLDLLTNATNSSSSNIAKSF